MNAIMVVLLCISLFCVTVKFGDESDAGPPAPAPEMEQLSAFCGTWDAEVEMMGQSSTGVETCRVGIGGYWLVTDFEGTFMGAPFLGHGLTGFDPGAKTFTGIWVDSTGSPMAHLEDGRFSDDGKTYTALAGGLDFQGNPARFRHTTRFLDENARSFEVQQVQEEGGEPVVMRISYKRKR